VKTASETYARDMAYQQAYSIYGAKGFWKVAGLPWKPMASRSVGRSNIYAWRMMSSNACWLRSNWSLAF